MTNEAQHTPAWWDAPRAVEYAVDVERLKRDATALLAALNDLCSRIPFASHLRRVQNGEERCKGCEACRARAALAQATGKKG
jgi:hypothetical protein